MPEFVRAEIKGIFAPRLTMEREQGDLSKWRPEDPVVFATPLMIFIGSTGSPSSDAFHATVCSPAWVSGHLDEVDDWELEGDVVSGKQLLIMSRWDYVKFRSTLDSWVGKFTGPTWGDVANRIGRVLAWEFAGKYDDQQNRAAEGADRATFPNGE